jgi:putative transposase
LKTYQFKLYNSKRNQRIFSQIELASEIYNHCIALGRRYYKRYGEYLTANRIKVHVTKLKKLTRFSHWKTLNSQAIQDVVERIDRGYKLFFNGHNKRPPKFKSRRIYKSFTLKQTGYAFYGNQLRIGNYYYKFWKSRKIEGNPKTVTVKRDALGDVYIYVVTDVSVESSEFMMGKTAGFDFGLKTFLTVSDGTQIESPEFFKTSIASVRKASKSHSAKKRGSNNRNKARLNLARKHKKIANQRHDFHFKLANHLTQKYDVLCFEDLNLEGMKRLWGRKVSDLGFSEFLRIVEYYASIRDKRVVKIDRFFPSSKTCFECGKVNKNLELSERIWQCDGCSTTHDRDKNAAKNIQRVGASTLGLGDVRSRSIGTVAA